MSEEDNILKHIALQHKGVVKAVKIKNLALQHKRLAIKKLKKALETEDVGEILKNLNLLYAIVDGAEKPLYASLVRHSSNYSSFIDYCRSRATDPQLKEIISSTERFINSSFPEISKILSLIENQSITLMRIKDSQNSDFEIEISLIFKYQEEMDGILNNLEGKTRTVLIPLLAEVAPKKSIFGAAKDFFGVPSKEEFRKAFQGNDEEIKYNVTLFIGEVCGMLGGGIGAAWLYQLTGNAFMAGSFGAFSGNWIFSDLGWLPSWYIANYKRLTKKDGFVKEKHMDFLKDTTRLYWQAVPAVIVTSLVETPFNLLFSTVLPPSVAVWTNQFFTGALNQSMCLWINRKVLWKMRAKRIQIEEEVKACKDHLVSKELSFNQNWWWHNKKDVFKAYKKAHSELRDKSSMIRYNLLDLKERINKMKIPRLKGAIKSINDLEESLAIISRIVSVLTIFQVEINKLKNEFLPVMAQKEISMKIVETKNSLLQEFNLLEQKLAVSST